VTERVVTAWNVNGNVFVEAGATYLPQLERVRQIVGEEMIILAAGVGAQGAQVTDLSSKLFGKQGKRLLVNSSRGIIFAGENDDDYFGAVRQAAVLLRDSLLVQAGNLSG
jgi:orotidine-5'-phosphate decarboxylase